MMIMLMKSPGGTTEESKDKIAAARAFPILEMRAGLRHALSTRPSCTHCVRSRHLQDADLKLSIFDVICNYDHMRLCMM